ncbi:MAG: NAD(P)H-dependent oxidoreductase subunit E [Chloroflexi bacterium]|nr:NAD(P)H-dependent oxidoreductase subunit E [Chloroflexota bacterium]MBI4198431.1 NAD(P)H-dependent oxidoreductase subunit E [Chloroflexota bacterium]
MQPRGDTLNATIRKALESHGNGAVTVLSSLLTLEDALGYIPPEAIEEVAHLTHTTVNDVWGVASFYPNFRFEPPCEHVVEVCWGPTCHLMGAPAVMKEVLATLGLNTEGDTPDKRVTLKFNTCLGACAQGPVMSLDHHLVGRLTPQEAGKRLSGVVGMKGNRSLQ